MSILLAIDDTDGPEGGCTTHLIGSVLDAVSPLALTDFPRLVRLNPNVPWKTRGNGAIVLPLGFEEESTATLRARGRSPSVKEVGQWGGRSLRTTGAPTLDLDAEAVLDAAWRVVQEHRQPDAKSAAAIFTHAPPEQWYWWGVQEILKPEEVQIAFDGVPCRSHGSLRGLVGCLAAAAWRGPPTSYELIAYRDPEQWGKRRRIQEDHLRGLDDTGATFHSYDEREERITCIPNTPCPVLAGLRGWHPDPLHTAALPALRAASREPIAGWALWATNQASGDHILPTKTLHVCSVGQTPQIQMQITDPPQRIQGGHVIIHASDAAGTREALVAFEPTKHLRLAVEQLVPRDIVTVVGSLHQNGIHLEKLRLDHAARPMRKVANPACCNKRMKRRGRRGGYRCAVCGDEAPEDAADYQPVPRQIQENIWHEPPVMARRHLHKPAQRMHVRARTS